MVLSDINNFFVGGGVAYCVYSTSVGGNYYITSDGYVLASDNKGACVQDQNPQSKSASGTGTLTFSFIRYTPYIFRRLKMLLNYLLYFK